MANKKVIVGAGMGSFPKALAAKVNVKLESPVQTIEARDDGVVVQLSGEQMCADHVVLAATAPIVSRTSSRQSKPACGARIR
jgi:protoporphyrinogen oxidase